MKKTLDWRYEGGFRGAMTVGYLCQKKKKLNDSSFNVFFLDDVLFFVFFALLRFGLE